MSERFDRWVKRMTGLLWAAGGGIFVAVMNPFLSSVWPRISKIFEGPTHIEATIHFLHASVVAIFYCLIFRFKPLIPRTGPVQNGQIDNKSHDAVEESANAFYWWWHQWWAVVFLFYLVLGAKALWSDPKTEPYWNGGMNLLSNFSGFCLLSCYLELVRPRMGRKLDVVRTSFVWVVIIMTGVNVLSMIFATHYSFNQWPQRSFMIWSGLATGVALALLVGRFESKYIGTPPWVLVFLYVYSVMQSTYGLFNTNLLVSETAAHVFRTVMSLIFLGLKVVLFTWVSWVFTRGRLTVYLENIAFLARGVQDLWSEIQFRDANGGATNSMSAAAK